MGAASVPFKPNRMLLSFDTPRIEPMVAKYCYIDVLGAVWIYLVSITPGPDIDSNQLRY
jgi:hypothetical protein